MSRPLQANETVNTSYTDRHEEIYIVPYDINGMKYAVKLLRQRDEDTFELLGYSNIRGKEIRDDIVYLDTDNNLEKYNYKHGYFKQYNEGDYKLRIQVADLDDKTVRELTNNWRSFQFHPYATPKSDAEVIENERVRNEEKEKEAKMANNYREQKERNEIKIYKNLIRKYMYNSTNKDRRDQIAREIERIWPILDREILLFRGQQNPLIQEIKTYYQSFFSTSLSEEVATRSDFTSFENKCCLFVIHAQPGLRYYSTLHDLYKVTDQYNQARIRGEILETPDEEEVLLESGGQFFQDKAKTVPGFCEMTFEEVAALGITDFDKTAFGAKKHSNEVEQKTGIFEAYYFPPEKEGGSRRKQRQRQRQKRKTRKQKQQKQKKRRSTRRQ